MARHEKFGLDTLLLMHCLALCRSLSISPPMQFISPALQKVLLKFRYRLRHLQQLQPPCSQWWQLLLPQTKTNNMRSIVLYSLVSLSLLVGCSKKDSPAPVVKTKTQLLTEKDWILVSHQEKLSSSSNYTDITNQYLSCVLDNRHVFYISGVFEENEGAVRCSGNPQVVETGTWSFLQNETKIRFVVPSGSINTTIETLSPATLIITYTGLVNGVSYDGRQTFSH